MNPRYNIFDTLCNSFPLLFCNSFDLRLFSFYRICVMLMFLLTTNVTVLIQKSVGAVSLRPRCTRNSFHAIPLCTNPRTTRILCRTSSAPCSPEPPAPGHRPGGGVGGGRAEQLERANV